MASYPSTTIDFLRHGEPQGGSKYRGTLDDPLSDIGWEQMQKTIDNYPAPWQKIVSSPLKRCSQFAKKTSEALSIPLEIEHDFREMNFGLWEGKTRKELLDDELYSEHVQNFWRNPRDHTPPQGEPIEDVHNRITKAWQTMLSNSEGDHILFVAHSGVIRVTIGMLLGIPLENLSRLLIPFAAMSRVRIDHIGDTPIPRLLFWHIGGAE
ncbi:MAG: histidine phosphatase family protein [Magnetococcales bacterium]|nr:histidine phosphatase family protein [Magnetococcales bacterium]